MSHLRLTVAGSLAAAALLAGGLSIALGAPHTAAAPAGATKVAHVKIIGNDELRSSPMTVRVHSRTVQVLFVDSDAYPHNIVVPALHFTSPKVSGDPGAMAVRFTLHFSRNGRYGFHCAYHVAAGMAGTFVVS